LLTSHWPHKLTCKAIGFVERWQKQANFSGGVDLIGSLPRGIRLPRLTGWRHHKRLSETTYRQFLAQARAILFFSAYEGFGMPPVEAMVFGACPVFSDISVTREVMGKTGCSFQNNSYESFAKAMDGALNMPESQIQLWAEQLLERHNWDKVVERITDGLMRTGEF
jgi:glycosyltransferase involved in cell wall biosynthesis